MQNSDGRGSGVRREPKEFSLLPEAAATWDQLTRLEQIRVELAVARVALNALQDGGIGPFLTATHGIAIEGEIAAHGREAMVRALKRTPRAG